MALLKRRETSNTQRIKKVFLKKLQVKIQKIFKKKWKRDVYCLKQSSNHTMNSRILKKKKMLRKSNSNKIYTLSLSRLSTLPTREQHSKFFYSYSYQIPLPTRKQQNHVIWNHQKDKTQTTKTILPPSNVVKMIN